MGYRQHTLIALITRVYKKILCKWKAWKKRLGTDKTCKTCNSSLFRKKRSLSASCKQNSHWKQDQEAPEKNNQDNLQQSYLKLKRKLSLKNGKLDCLLQFLIFFFINFITLILLHYFINFIILWNFVTHAFPDSFLWFYYSLRKSSTDTPDSASKYLKGIFIF